MEALKQVFDIGEDSAPISHLGNYFGGDILQDILRKMAADRETAV